MASSAFAETVSAVGIETTGQNTYIAVLRADPNTTPPKVFQLGGDQPRIVIDWAAANISVPPGGFQPSGHISAIRHASRGSNGLRLVLDLAPGSKLMAHEVFQHQVNLHVHGAGMKAVPALPSPNTRIFEGKSIPYPRLKPHARHVSKAASPSQAVVPAYRPSKFVIVIDPGHGGRDPGAIGRKGTQEKSITLKAAIELKRQLLATGKYQVILTRSGDKYIAHEERIRIARASGGDLFISIHADATKGRSARGASVYTLADRARKRTKKEVVSSQNWIMDVDLSAQSDPVGDILVDLAQRKTVSESTKFANTLIANLSGHTKLIGNTHRRAGYFVLLAPDVPAVLLELGFISNSQDEALLRTASHRKKVMRSVTTAINRHFAHQKP